VSKHFIMCYKVMDSSEPCSLPGGLASVKKQFESHELSSSSASQSTVIQHQYQQRQVGLQQMNTQGIYNTHSNPHKHIHTLKQDLKTRCY